PNGLDGIDKKGRHETTAQDLAKIMARCIKNQQFLEITQTKQYTFTDGSRKRRFICNNHNALLSSMQGVISGKTGYTSKAGYCYVGAVKQKNMTMTFSVLASGWPPHKTYKWKDVRKLVQYATDHYERREIIADTSKIKEISIKNGLKEKVLLKTGNLKAAFLVKKTDKIK
ncbi:MAG TPA: D-alanyl-D-alanine carboxypeptidase, partial [Anaerostipes hadrus]|nr:D-alanyl-D-alanine carboxypeptidase [Anaerostipes hadrus]